MLMDWLEQAKKAARTEECLSLEYGPLPGRGSVVMLAPHPDDPDTCAVFQKMLQLGGWEIWWVVLTSGWSGVRDEFAGTDKEAKTACRWQEQLDSCHLFGLNEDWYEFLGLPETDDGELADNLASYRHFASDLNELAPDIVILPWGKDTNATHRLTYEWFMRWRADRPVTAFFAEDPKSLDFTPHLEIVFDEETAAWKASLLECHRSQTDRNLATRGITFSERILSVNRRETGFVERYRIMG